jgi:hypothetical protein
VVLRWKECAEREASDMPMFCKCSSSAVLVSTSIKPDVALEYPPEGLYLFFSKITAIGKELNDRGG